MLAVGGVNPMWLRAREQGKRGKVWAGQPCPASLPDLRAKPVGQGEPNTGQGSNPVIRDHTH